jgi:hypothetical protein
MFCLLRSYRRVFVLALAALPALTGETAAPGRVEVRAAGQLPPVDSILNRDEVPLGRKLALAMAASRSSESSGAGEVIAASIDEVNSYLTTSLSHPSSVSILVDRGEDILVAQWPLNPPTEGVAPVLLWDDSISETIVFRCSADRISTPTSVERLVDGLMNWNNRRLGSAGLSVRQPAVPGTVLVGYGYRRADAIPSQFDVGVEVTFSGFISGKVGYLGVSFVSHSGAFPNEMKGIDERFPPLLERVPHWTTARLIAEIGHSRRHKSLFGMYIGIYLRDRVLVHELVKREDLTVAAFEDLLVRGIGNGPSYGNVVPEPIRAAIEAHRVGKFAETIDRYMDRHPPLPDGYLATDNILLALTSDREIDLEERAIHYLESGVAIGSSLKYLEIRGQTEKAREAAASVNANGQWKLERKAALAAIDARISERR